jgi:putative FmdB family regulatory protein
MPTYVYRCPGDDCGFEQEVVHGMDENPTPRCPACEQADEHGRRAYSRIMERVIQPAPFRTRGPGFYDTGRP